MKKELAQHFLALIILFAAISIFRTTTSWIFWVGGIIGTILPDIDHIIYIYYLRPYEVTSQRVMYEVSKGNLWQSWDILSKTRSERTNLIFHTILFQVLFLILGFLVLSSSLSLLGRGLIVSFLLHLFIDQIIDLKQNGNLMNWFKNIPFILDKVQLNIYLITNFVIILLFGFLM
jgi:hypothetical protein